ncbi:alpha/beta hydrolase-fold protein [Streptomyces sp. G-G2]|uniref:alpha/beta hydrolase n=1 Tax=Streptomyces sp. G-G2 TaxID=3046201 RepID=UPI0024B918F5|nr:alpha/beta hydrolase-fold protein [Streptomyces sp. G-G2]MDJ0381454.1 alpha/beta hydrolase-fold protein [Streptomyces sp. G-G2]
MRPRTTTAATATSAAVLLTACLTASLAACSGQGARVSFDAPATTPTATPTSGVSPRPVSEAERLTLPPTGPEAEFHEESRLPDGTTIGVTTLEGQKSGFTGKVWVWAPKQYFEPQYAHSGFPVLIALPGGRGFPKNYWMAAGLKLQSSIAHWSLEGRSLPFLVVMPVLNPDKSHYYDGSDIPGQPKMGTWLTEDVPDLVRANFRTFRARDGWAFMGSSSGGFAALKSVLQKPDQFKAAIASGPDTVPDSPLWKGFEDERQANNPERLSTELAAKTGPDVYLAFQVGSKESSLPNVQKFIANYGKGPVKTHLQVIQGGEHNAKTYIRGMGEGTMKWISDHLQAPVPTR